MNRAFQCAVEFGVVMVESIGVLDNTTHRLRAEQSGGLW